MRLITRRHQTKRIWREGWRFCAKNKQLFFLLFLVVLGAVLGCTTYTLLSDERRQLFSSVASVTTVPNDFVSGCTAVASSAFSVCCILVVVFLLGLTAYGCPLILIAPLFFGFCLGVAECQAYIQGGFWQLSVQVLLPMSVAMIPVLIATSQALRMSCVFSRQLLPSSAHCGGMWQEFKMYLLRFLLCFFLAFAAALIQVLLQLI